MTTKATMTEESSTLATKCLDLCQALSSQGKPFTFSMNVGSSFSFSLDTKVSSISCEVIKKKLGPSAMRRNMRRKEDFLKKKSESLKKRDDTHPEAKTFSHVKSFQCDQCEQTFMNEKGLKIHVGKTHKENIPQLDGFIDETTAFEAVKTPDLKHKEDDLKEVEEVIHVNENTLVHKTQVEEPFELKFRIEEKKHSSDIYDSYLKEPLPLNMPKTILHPIDGKGEFDGYFKKFKNKYTYRFKTNRGMSWKTFHVGEKSPWD